MTAQKTSVAAMKMAVRNKAVRNGMLFHSDRRIYYTYDKCKSILSDNNIIQSIGRKVNYRDNAIAESFFKSLKEDMVYQRRFTAKYSSKLEFYGFIEGFYNSKYNKLSFRLRYT